MMVSPGSSSLVSASMVVSVILPAGNMTQTARGLSSFFDEIFERRSAGGTFGGEAADGLGVLVIDDGGVTVLHQAADNISAHSAETDHAELHCVMSFIDCA